MNSKSKIISILIVGAVAQGCSMSPAKQGETDRSLHRIESVEVMNSRLLASVEKSLRVLATTKNALRVSLSSEEKMKKDEWMYSVTPDGMSEPISMEPWTGTLKSVIDMIASFSGYEVEEVGVANPNARNVTVSGVGRPAVDYLRDVAMQAGCDALVKPVSTARLIIIDWTYRFKSDCK